MYDYIKTAGVAAALIVATVAGTAHATPITAIGDYDVSSVTTGGNQHSVWLVGLGSSNYWQFDTDGGLFTWDGRRARLSGNLEQNGDANNTLAIDVIFSYRPEGRGAIDPKTGGGTNIADWDYFNLDSGSIMGNVGGSMVSYDLTIRPSEELPAQLGVGANDKDGSLGFSSWVFWDGDRIGDINIRLSDQPISGTPSPIPLPASGMLMIAGLGAIGFAARRRRQTS